MKQRRTNSRERVLTDDEIRAVWCVEGFWGNFSRLLLLTAARRTELAEMTRDELSGGLCTIPGERVKNGKEVARPLSRSAQQMLPGMPTLDGCKYVFTTDGRGPVTRSRPARLRSMKRAASRAGPSMTSAGRPGHC